MAQSQAGHLRLPIAWPTDYLFPTKKSMSCKVHYNYLLAVLKIKMSQDMSSSCTLFLICFPARAECCGRLLAA